MEDLLDVLLFKDGLSSDERAALRERMEAEPELARAWVHWRRVRLHVRGQLEERVSDRRLLVMYVLEQEGEEDALTARERAALAEAQDEVEEVIEAIPALKRVVDCIREDCADFEKAWASVENQGDAPSTAEPLLGKELHSGRIDRSPEEPQSREQGSLRRYSRGLLALAVAVTIVVMAVFFWPQPDARTAVTVPEGTIETVSFSEGSSARVVGPAALSHPKTDDGRLPGRVTLQRGQAFFDVQQQGDRSFVVETPAAVATVVGTRFGVRTTVDTTEVILASGALEVGSRDGMEDRTAVLVPGQKTWVSKDSVVGVPTSVDVIEELEWTGLFVFQSTEMSTIADQLSRQYDSEILVADELTSEPVTATFDRNQPVGEIVRALGATLGAQVETSGENAYRLVSRE